MSIASDLVAAAALLTADAAIMRAIVQGPATGGASIVTLPTGPQVKTLARAASEVSGGYLLLTGGTLSGNLNGPNFLIANQLTTDAGTVGFSNANGPAWVFFGTASVGAGALVANVSGATVLTQTEACAQVASAGQLGFNSRGGISAPSDGVFTLLNAAGTDFTRLQLGGTTAGFPAWRRTGAAVEAVLADNSAYAEVGALSFLAKGGTSAWSFDTTALAQTIADGGTFAFAAGAGFIFLTRNSNGNGALFYVGGGSTYLIWQAGSGFAAGAPDSGKIGLEYSGGVYRLNNNTGSSELIGIGGIRPRASV